VKGRFKSLASDGRSAIIEHEEIPDYMPAMTMSFPVRNAAELKKLNPGDAIAFRFVVTENDSWIEQVKRISNDAVAASPASRLRSGAPNQEPLEIGDLVPNFQLINQRGESFQLDDLMGKHVVLSFIFVRCPVPNFCPLMSANFRKIQDQLAKEELFNEVRLLSVTIDPEFDTPEVLKTYATHYNANDARWIFATGSSQEIEGLTDRFAVYAERRDGTILHELVTAYIAPDGRLVRVWRGNDWKPNHILGELRTSLETALTAN
ncbi:MAG: SCO family protein, partial [Limisphaerales bacterium]